MHLVSMAWPRLSPQEHAGLGRCSPSRAKSAMVGQVVAPEQWVAMVGQVVAPVGVGQGAQVQVVVRFVLVVAAAAASHSLVLAIISLLLQL